MSFLITNSKLVYFNSILFCLLFNSLKSFSQNDSAQKTKAEILDVYISAGPSKFPVFSISQKDFKKIVPDSKLMSGDLMEVDNNNYNKFPYSDSSEGGNYLSVPAIGLCVQGGITLKLKDQEIKNVDGPWLKIGANYFSYFTLLNSGVYKTITRHYDTLYYVGAIPIERDSVNSRKLTYKYGCKSVNLETTLLYKFNDKGIFSLFGGPGIMLGMNFDGFAEIRATHFRGATDRFILSEFDRVLYKESAKEEVQTEEFKFGPNVSFGLFIDCGIDLRLGNTLPIVKNTHLFAEIKPMFRGNGVKGGGIQQSVLFVSDFGLRYEFK